MNQKQIRAAVEAMLFASGDPLAADKLAQAVPLPHTCRKPVKPSPVAG